MDTQTTPVVVTTFLAGFAGMVLATFLFAPTPVDPTPLQVETPQSLLVKFVK